MKKSINIKSAKLAKSDLPPLDGVVEAPHFLVEIELSDGSVIERDLEPFLTGPTLSQLRMDRALFEKITVKNGNLTWPAQVEIPLEQLIPKEEVPPFPVPPAFLSVLLLTPFSLLIFPGYFVWCLIESLVGKEIAWARDGYGSWIMCIFSSMTFWTLLTGLCLLVT